MKHLIIMRGLPGYGKSTTAKYLAEQLGGKIVSTDDYFMVNGKYEFNRDNLGKAHQWCRYKTSNLIIKETPVIIVDNTNVCWSEIKPYVELSRGYQVHFLEPHREFDLDLSFNRNTHGVPVTSIERMNDRYQTNADVLISYIKGSQ